MSVFCSIAPRPPKARTRTLVQIGGLVVKSGLLEHLGIPVGADIQRDYGRASSILAGLLQDAAEFYAETRGNPETDARLVSRGADVLKRKER